MIDFSIAFNDNCWSCKHWNNMCTNPRCYAKKYIKVASQILACDIINEKEKEYYLKNIEEVLKIL